MAKLVEEHSPYLTLNLVKLIKLFRSLKGDEFLTRELGYYIRIFLANPMTQVRDVMVCVYAQTGTCTSMYDW